MIQQKIYFSEATYNKMFEDGYLGTANIIFEKTLHKGEIFDIGKQRHFYIVDEDLKQRIDKAIEYLENEGIDENTKNYYCCNDVDGVDLYKILKGSDSNVKN